MGISVKCADCGGHAEATCHLGSFEDTPWLCRECCDKRVAALRAQMERMARAMIYLRCGCGVREALERVETVADILALYA